MHTRTYQKVLKYNTFLANISLAILGLQRNMVFSLINTYGKLSIAIVILMAMASTCKNFLHNEVS